MSAGGERPDGATSAGGERAGGELTRRSLLATGAAVLVARALRIVPAPTAQAAEPLYTDATLQAYFDTIIPGRRVARTALGNAVHPRAIAGVDDRPGAVEADALALGQHPLIGFSLLAPAFLTELELRSLAAGARDFLSLDFDGRIRACQAGLDFGNPLRVLWEAGAAVAYDAFCGAGLARTPEQAVGYQVMGLPFEAPAGYPDASYGRRLASERTQRGSLP